MASVSIEDSPNLMASSGSMVKLINRSGSQDIELSQSRVTPLNVAQIFLVRKYLHMHGNHNYFTA